MIFLFFDLLVCLFFTFYIFFTWFYFLRFSFYFIFFFFTFCSSFFWTLIFFSFLSCLWAPKINGLWQKYKLLQLRMKFERPTQTEQKLSLRISFPFFYCIFDKLLFCISAFKPSLSRCFKVKVWIQKYLDQTQKNKNIRRVPADVRCCRGREDSASLWSADTAAAVWATLPKSAQTQRCDGR